MTAIQTATYTWHPVDGAAVTVSLYRHPGLANQRRCVVDGKSVGYVWQRNVCGFKTIWSYRFESDTLGIVRGSCRDRDEAVSRLMFAARAAAGGAGEAYGVVADEASK